MTQVIAPGRTKEFRLYHTLLNKRGPKGVVLSRTQIGTARRMARQDFTAEQIREALKIDSKPEAFRQRLAKFNIRPRAPKNKSARRGDITSLPHDDMGINSLSYRPKQIGAA